AALMFDAIAGPDPRDPTALDAPPPAAAQAARNGTLKGVRIGLDAAYALESVEPPIAAALRSALSAMERAGAIIVDVHLPEVRGHLLHLYKSAAVEAAISHAANYPSEASSYSGGYAGFLDLGRETPSVEYAEAAIWRREFRGGLARIFKTVDM